MNKRSFLKKNHWIALLGAGVLVIMVCCAVWSGNGAEPVAAVQETTGPVLSLNEPLPMPIPPQQGRGEPMEHLVPMYGADYAADPVFQNAVTAFRRWQWNVVYRELDTIVTEDPDNLDGYRFQAEVYMIGSKYEAALGQIDQILRRDPRDIHALAVSAILYRILENEAGEQERLAALEAVSPEAAAAVATMLTEVENLWNAPYDSQPQTDMVPDAIVVFGQTPKSNGTPSGGLLHRLEKALELALRFPEAAIIVSGGDVKTEYTEASVMKTWLVEQGIPEERIYMDELARDTYGNAVGSLELLQELDAHKAIVAVTRLHQPRATTTMTLYAKYQGYALEVDSAGSGDTQVKDEGERLYTYVNGARAAGLFTKGDYQKFNHE